MQTVTHSDALSRFGCALSDPTRAEILLMLREAPGYPSDLAEKIGVTPADPVQPPGLSSRLRTGGRRARGPAQSLSARRRADRARTRRSDRPGAHRRSGLLSRRRSRRLLLMSAPVRPRREVLARRIRMLVAATITYNIVEAVVALAEGTRVSSSALIGFGLDSVDRGLVGGRYRVAVLRQGPGDAGKGRAAVHRVLVLRARRIRFRRRGAVAAGLRRGATVADRHRACGGQPRRHAGAVLGAAARRSRTGIGFGGCGFETDAALHLSVRGPAGRSGAQRASRLVVGGSGRCVGHRRDRGS